MVLVILVAAVASGGTAAGLLLADRNHAAASACARAKDERSAVESVAVQQTGAGSARANTIHEAALVLGSPPHCFTPEQYRDAYAQMKQALSVG